MAISGDHGARLVAGSGGVECLTDERRHITELHNCAASPEVSLAVVRGVRSTSACVRL